MNVEIRNSNIRKICLLAIAILLVVIWTNYAQKQWEQRIPNTIKQCESIASSITDHPKLNAGEKRQYIMDKLDYWGAAYVVHAYESNGKTYLIGISCGPDCLIDTDDDIRGKPIEVK